MLNVFALQARNCHVFCRGAIMAALLSSGIPAYAATVVAGSASGALNQHTLQLSVTPDSTDAGRSVNLYVAATIGDKIFFAGGTPVSPIWSEYRAGAFPNLGSVTLPADASSGASSSGTGRPAIPGGSAGSTISAFSGLDVTTLAGARVYAGYGSSDQELAAGKYQHGYTIPAASHLNLPYAGKSSAQILDLYIPAGTGPFPVVINIHGGGFRSGDKAMLDTSIQAALLSAGYAVASINYRLSGEAVFPAAVQDAKAAVRFLRANAVRYQLDKHRFVAFGQSAGGNIASMLGATGDVAATRSRGLPFDDPALGNTDESSAVQAVIDWFGPTDFTQMDAQSTAQGCVNFDPHNPATSLESTYMGVKVGDSTNNAIVQESNPITYLTRNAPPYHLVKGSTDCNVPAGQSRLLFEALQTLGVASSLTVFEGAGHGTPKSTWLAPTTIQGMLDFIRRELPR